MGHSVECSLTATKIAPSSAQSYLNQYGSQLFATQIQMPPLEARIEISAAYFNYIHNPTHQLFHEPTFMAAVSQERVPYSILLSIIAIAAR